MNLEDYTNAVKTFLDVIDKTEEEIFGTPEINTTKKDKVKDAKSDFDKAVDKFLDIVNKKYEEYNTTKKEVEKKTDSLDSSSSASSQKGLFDGCVQDEDPIREEVYKHQKVSDERTPDGTWVKDAHGQWREPAAPPIFNKGGKMHVNKESDIDTTKLTIAESIKQKFEMHKNECSRSLAEYLIANGYYTPSFDGGKLEKDGDVYVFDYLVKDLNNIHIVTLQNELMKATGFSRVNIIPIDDLGGSKLRFINIL